MPKHRPRELPLSAFWIKILIFFSIFKVHDRNRIKNDTGISGCCLSEWILLLTQMVIKAVKVVLMISLILKIFNSQSFKIES